MSESEYLSLSTDELSQPELHSFLLTAVAPRPIALVSTVDGDGRVNLSPFSFFNVFSSNPPIMIFSPARRGRDNTTKHTYENLKIIGEVVINIVNYSMVEKTSLASTEYDKGVNEFKKSGLTEIPSDLIRPPRVKESPVAFECSVDRIIELGDQGGAGNLVFARVLRIHINKNYLNEEGKLDPLNLDQVARMGGNWYSRSSSDSMFEIEKPLRSKGIGVDSLPASVRNSEILSGNDLGQLGNMENFPRDEVLAGVLAMPQFIANGDRNFHHSLAKDLLARGEKEKALAILIASDKQG